MRPSDASDSVETEHTHLAELVGSLIRMMNAGNMARLDVEYKDLRVSLRSHGDAERVAPNVAAATTASPLVAEDDDGASAGDHTIVAPMIGTFYRSPAPNEPPYVSEGDVIEEGQTIGIIEAMKIMNEIAADRAGTVVEILAANAQPVEFGSPLVRLDTSSP